MSSIHSVIFLLGAAVLLAQLALKVKVPYPIFLVLGGLVIGFVPGLPTIEIPSEIIFLVFLPPLLNSSAFATSPLELRTYLRPITALAIGLVLLTTVSVGIVAHFAIGLQWAPSFVLGAILAPTDPVAAESVFRRLGAPGQVSAIVGGESLVNDGTGLVAYRIALGAVAAGTFSIWQAGLSFILVGGGGLLLGVVLAYIILPLWARIEDSSVLITASLLIPYGVYILGEEVLHVSGILAIVAYGLYQGWRAPQLFPEASTRLRALSFWGVLVFLLEALLFVLLGEQLPSLLSGIKENSLVTVLLYAALVWGLLVLTRMAWFFTVPFLHPVFDRLLRSTYLRGLWQERLVMGWSGMRGAVSLAAALAIPLQIEGEAFPGRDLILFIVYVTILATLVIQGLTLGPLLRTLRIESDENSETLAELEARVAAAHAALARLEESCEEAGVSPEAQESMREHYSERIRRYSAGLQAGGATQEYREGSAAWRGWRRGLIAAERETVISLRDQGRLPSEAAGRIQRDLDLEESRIGG